MLRIIFLIAGVLWSRPALAKSGCDRIVPGYEAQDVIYVLCDDLSPMTDALASELATQLLRQYIGPPDELLIRFVSSAEFVGKAEIPAEAAVGYLYTHSQQLVIWPELPEKSKTFSISWQ